MTDVILERDNQFSLIQLILIPEITILYNNKKQYFSCLLNINTMTKLEKRQRHEKKLLNFSILFLEL